jgi:hypothetical protein
VEGVPYGDRRLAAGRSLRASDPVDPRSGDLEVRYFNGRRGLDPGVPFAADRLLTSQVAWSSTSTRMSPRGSAEAAEYSSS